MPVEYKTVLLGSSDTLSGLSGYQPQEEGTPEGSLIMLELNFNGAVSTDVLDSINDACADAGVTPWPGYTNIAYLDSTGQKMTLLWVKGFAWLPLIIGILVLTVLPALLGAVLWWIIPEEVKAMIEAVVMLLMMVLMMKMMMPMFAQEEKPKQVREAE